MDRWTPLFTRSSDRGQRAWELLDALYAAADEPAAGRRADAFISIEALAFTYLSLADPDSHWRAAAISTLNIAIDGADTLVARGQWGLHGGLAGLGWVVEHVSRIFSGNESSNLNDDTDAALLRELERGQWRGPADLERGLAGIGIYFLERLPNGVARPGASLVIAHLESLARKSGPASLFPPHSRLDVMRGAPGVIHFLNESLKAQIEPDTSSLLLARAVDWLVGEDVRTLELRDALGVAAICLEVARNSGRTDCSALARRLVDEAVTVPVPAGPIGESTLVSGASDIAHTFNHLYQSEGDERCRTKALAWLDAILASPGNPSHATGNGAGVALTLVAAMTAIPPAWDRRIALSGREPLP